MKPIRTAVIILNWNNASDTAACLESLSRSTVRVLPIVIDNASTKPGFDDLEARFPEAIYLRNAENLGFGRGNNVGLKWALDNTDASYLFIFNNDALVKPDTIGLLEEFLNSCSEEVGAATPQITFADEPEIVWYGGGEIAWHRGSALAQNLRSRLNLKAVPRPVTFASGCAMLLRRSTIEHVGGFDPFYFMYEEDVDLSLRLSRAGYLIMYVPQAVVYHKVQGSLREENQKTLSLYSPQNPKLAFYMYYLTRNRLLNMYRYARGKDKLRFLIFFPILWLIKIIQFAINGRWDGIRAIVRGYRSYYRLRQKSYIDEVNGKKFYIDIK